MFDFSAIKKSIRPVVSAGGKTVCVGPRQEEPTKDQLYYDWLKTCPHKWEEDGHESIRRCCDCGRREFFNSANKWAEIIGHRKSFNGLWRKLVLAAPPLEPITSIVYHNANGQRCDLATDLPEPDVVVEKPEA